MQLSVNEVEAQVGRQAEAKLAPRTTVIIPAYNEEEGIGVVLQKLFSVIDETYEVIVVDDGSTDSTVRVAAEFPCRIVRHPRNLGKGASMRSGAASAMSERIVFLDADDQHPADIVPQMARALDRYDVVVATRTHNGTSQPTFHRIGNFVFSRLIRHLYHYKPSDPLTGFIGVKRTQLLNMNLDSRGFTVETEIAIKSASMGLNILDIPIHHSKRKGTTKLRAISDGYEILRTIVRMLALYNPNITFTIPGGLLFFTGVGFMALLMTYPINVANVGIGIHSFVLAAILSLSGFHLAAFGLAMKAYALTYKFTKDDVIIRLFMRRDMAKFFFGLGALMVLTSASLGMWVGFQWVTDGAIPFDRAKGLILSAFFTGLGLDAAISAVFLSVFFGELGKVSNLRGAGANPIDG